ncbi:MAG: hypothetical protein DMF94_20210 [Acidobacteria bacterium]|nr:MAG: hypothetical protein DMF94_20210 [Acidobacteriota bacterium]
MERVHTTLTQVARTRSRRNWTGLAIMKHLIELHGGSVRAEHGAEGGARFVLTLPMQG